MKALLTELQDLTSETFNRHWTFVVDAKGYFRLTFYRVDGNIKFKSKDDPDLCFRNAVNFIKENRQPIEKDAGFKL